MGSAVSSSSSSKPTKQKKTPPMIRKLDLYKHGEENRLKNDNTAITKEFMVSAAMDDPSNMTPDQQQQHYILNGSKYASYLPNPILCLREWESLNKHLSHSPGISIAPKSQSQQQPNLEHLPSLLQYCHHFALLTIRIKFKCTENHRKNINGYIHALNEYMHQMAQLVVQRWGGYLWKIEADTIYCIFTDLKESYHLETEPNEHDTRQQHLGDSISEHLPPFGASQRTQDETLYSPSHNTAAAAPDSLLVKLTRYATLCAHELKSRFNKFHDRKLGIIFHLHQVITAGKNCCMMHTGGVQDKWQTILFMGSHHNTLINHLLHVSRKGQIILTNEAHAIIENDHIELTQEEFKKSRHKSRISQQQQEKLKEDRILETEAKSILSQWVRSSTHLDHLAALEGDASQQQDGFLNLDDAEADDLGSLFDSDEEREYLTARENRRNQSLLEEHDDDNGFAASRRKLASIDPPHLDTILAVTNTVQLRFFEFKQKNDAWYLQDVFYEYDRKMRDDIHEHGFQYYLSDLGHSFTDRSLYTGYLTTPQLARIENHMTKTPQQVPLTLLAVKFHGLASLRVDKQLVQDCIITIQKVLLTYHGSIQDIKIDAQSNLVVIAEFGLELGQKQSSHGTARCAVECAQDIQSLLEESHDFEVKPSQAIASGYLYACEIGSEFRRAFTLLGDTLSLVLELANQSTEFGILVDQHTYLSTRRFIPYYTSLKPLHRNGKEILIYSPAFAGFDLMVGRQNELQETQSLVDTWFEGETDSSISSIVLKGESGIGKSVLTQEIIQYCVKYEYSFFSVEGETMQNYPLLPFRNLVGKLLFGGHDAEYSPRPTDSAAAAFRKRFPQLQKDAQLLANKFILPMSTENADANCYPNSDSAQEYDRNTILQLYLTLIHSIIDSNSTSNNRILCILQNIHLFDELSLQLVHLMRTELKNVLFLETTTSLASKELYWIEREEERLYNNTPSSLASMSDQPPSPPPSSSHYVDLLSPLKQENIRTMICSLTRSRSCADSVVHLALQIGKGHPLCTRELLLLWQSKQYIDIDAHLHTKFTERISFDDVKERTPPILKGIIQARYGMQREVRRQILQFVCAHQQSLTLSILSSVIPVKGYTEQLPSILRELEELHLVKSIHSSQTREPHFVVDNPVLAEVISESMEATDLGNVHSTLLAFYLHQYREERTVLLSNVDFFARIGFHASRTLQHGVEMEESFSLFVEALPVCIQLARLYSELGYLCTSKQLFDDAEALCSFLIKHSDEVTHGTNTDEVRKLCLELAHQELLHQSTHSLVDEKHYSQQLVDSQIPKLIFEGEYHLGLDCLLMQKMDEAQTHLKNAQDAVHNCADNLSESEKTLWVKPWRALCCAFNGKLQESSSILSLDEEQSSNESVESDLQEFCTAVHLLIGACTGNFARVKHLHGELLQAISTKEGDSPTFTPSSLYGVTLSLLSLGLLEQPSHDWLLTLLQHVDWRRANGNDVQQALKQYCFLLDTLCQTDEPKTSVDEEDPDNDSHHETEDTLEQRETNTFTVARKSLQTRILLSRQQKESSLFLPLLLSAMVDSLLKHPKEGRIHEALKWIFLGHTLSAQQAPWIQSLFLCHEAHCGYLVKKLGALNHDEQDAQTKSRMSTRLSDISVSQIRQKFNTAVSLLEKQGCYGLLLQVLVKWYIAEEELGNFVQESGTKVDKDTQLDHDYSVAEKRTANTERRLDTLSQKFVNFITQRKEVLMQQVSKRVHLQDATRLLERCTKAMEHLQASIQKKQNHASLSNFERCAAAVREISPESLREMYTLTKPPRSVKLLVHALGILKGIPLDEWTSDEEKKSPSPQKRTQSSPQSKRKRSQLDSYWHIVRGKMQETNGDFLRQFAASFDPHSITDTKVDKIRKVLSPSSDVGLSNFSEADIRKTSEAATVIFKWICSIIDVHDIQKELTAQLHQLERERSVVATVDAHLQKIREDTDSLQNKLQDLEHQIELLQDEVEECQNMHLSARIDTEYYRDLMHRREGKDYSKKGDTKDSQLEMIRERIRDCLEKHIVEAADDDDEKDGIQLQVLGRAKEIISV